MIKLVQAEDSTGKRSLGRSHASWEYQIKNINVSNSIDRRTRRKFKLIIFHNFS